MWRKRCPELQHLWPADDDVVTWEGVTFDEKGAAGRVVHIGLSSRGLIGALPPEFGRLDALQTLDLMKSNNVTELPAEIGNLALLKEFDIRDNLMKSVPSELGRCVELEDLWLNENKAHDRSR